MPDERSVLDQPDHPRVRLRVFVPVAALVRRIVAQLRTRYFDKFSSILKSFWIVPDDNRLTLSQRKGRSVGRQCDLPWGMRLNDDDADA